MLNYLQALIASRKTREEGASAVEYGLLVALIAAVIVLVVLALGGILKEAFFDTCNSIQGTGSITTSTCGSTATP